MGTEERAQGAEEGEDVLGETGGGGVEGGRKEGGDYYAVEG